MLYSIYFLATIVEVEFNAFFFFFKDPLKYSPLVEDMLEKVFDCDSGMLNYLDK